MLTDTKLRTLKAKAKLYRVADTNGLCIEVRTNGARIWRYRHRHAGKASLLGLGNYPTVAPYSPPTHSTQATCRSPRERAIEEVRLGLTR
jgi:hypothetical protein